MVRPVLLLGSLMACLALTPQLCTAAQVTGIVCDSDTATLANATVTLLSDTIQLAVQTSDDSGWFSFTPQESARANAVRAQLIGYRSVIFTLSRPDQHVEFRLRHSTLFPQRGWRIQLAANVSVNTIRSGGFVAELSDGPTAFTFPRVLEPGDPFVLELASHGSSSCTRPDRVVTTADYGHVNIIVLDRVRSGACSADWAAFPREITHRFDLAGEKLIRIVGLRDDIVIRVTVERRASGPH